MNKEGVLAVGNTAGVINWPTWPTRREITITIDSARFLMTVSHPGRLIGNGNLVVWNVGSISGYTVEIELEAKANPTSLSQGTGTTVSGNIKGASSEPGSRVAASYSVYLKDKSGSRTKLGRVGAIPPADLAGPVPTLDEPALMIDRMGDPPS